MNIEKSGCAQLLFGRGMTDFGRCDVTIEDNRFTLLSWVRFRRRMQKRIAVPASRGSVAGRQT